MFVGKYVNEIFDEIHKSAVKNFPRQSFETSILGTAGQDGIKKRR